ncbi:hypothetical protein KP509_22G019900 [Ceratopteris richardii]|uniref:Uncharacterized protein n=1 Tax=Ceratopteris richardii TaxID=49495 RepID=A0A8T2S564_CERRI|nr:hypothetical protein KP509_22G019900 [Ceratopteris richardii]
MALTAASLLVVLAAAFVLVVAAVHAALTARDQHQQTSTLGRGTEEWTVLKQAVGDIVNDQDDVEPYAYAQWIAFELSYTGEGSLCVQNASLEWGKWYDYPDEDREIAAPNGQAIAPGSILYVAASGRENSPSGTEGTFEIWSSTLKIAHFHFDCPWSGSNKLEINRFSTQYVFDFSTAPSSGPIGLLPLHIYAK